MRLPHVRRAAPEVLATAWAQRWEPTEGLRVLLVEVVGGRDRSSTATRLAAAKLPTGRTFDAWDDTKLGLIDRRAAIRRAEELGP